jgi:cyclopropane-fatty-acyl-phospholipid synthase
MESDPMPMEESLHSSLLEERRLTPDVAWGQIYEEPLTTPPYRGAALAVTVLTQLFRDYSGSVAVRLWNGEAFSVGTARSPPVTDVPFVLVFRDPQVVSTMILGRDPLRLAEAYFRSDLDIEGDLSAALGIKDYLESLRIPARAWLSVVIKALRLRALNPRQTRWFGENVPSHGRKVRAHSKDENLKASHFHYDVSNDFYKLWLDRSMVYSCAYFEQSNQSLDEAQQAKLDHVCRKLLLRPNERLLDIGCGWGALLIHAASQYGVYAHGVTLSERQLTVARQRIAEAGLAGRVTVELKDYRDLQEGSFDKVASVGMFEHVGLKNLPLYFATVHRLLNPGGLFLNHGITHVQAGWHKNISTRFINRYVFPDAELDSLSNVQNVMERAHFEIEDVEALRVHSAMTLRGWLDGLEHRYDEALDWVSEATFRVWRLYLTACALEFESGRVGVYQVLASKRGAGKRLLPLTRRHLYDEH